MLPRNEIRRLFKPLSIVLTVALLFALLPVHFHLHHAESEGTASHQHIIDLHVISDASEQEHHEEAHIVDVASDGLVKQLDGPALPSELFFFFLVILPLIKSRVRQHLDEDALLRKKIVFRHSPPLRAPPAF